MMVKSCITLSITAILLSLLFWYSQPSPNNPKSHLQRNLYSSKGSLFFPGEKFKITTKDVKLQSNQVFKYNFSYLDIDFTQNLNLSDYSCRPVNFGFSVTEGNQIFPEYHYSDCSNVTGVKVSRVFIDRKSSLLSLDCEDPLTGYYFSGPLQNMTLMRKSSTSEFILNKYTHPVQAENISFAAGLCSPHSDLNESRRSYGLYKKYNINPEDFQHGDMKPVFNQKLYKEKLAFVEGKPRIIFMLTLDSLSRRHFYRKLPKLVQYLNASESTLPHMAVYDFKLHSTFGSDSVHNQVPIFSGKNATEVRKKLRNQDGLKNSSMWFNLKNKGFMTVMGFDDCDSWFPNVLGQNPQVDFSIRQFYCLLDVYGQVKTEKMFTEQRCFGPHQTHHYSLKYILELIKQYQGVNMWIYLHLNAGHEQTGQHANTLDDDVTQFLKNLFQITKEKSETFMFLGADHGMRYGNWHHSIEAHQETLLPSMFLIADKSLLNDYPYAYHSLSENSKRLTSKLDIRKTIFSLSRIFIKVPNAVNLIGEIASFSRDCEDLNSDILFCACSKIKEIESYNETVRIVLETITQRIENELNRMTYYFPGFPVGKFCDKVVLDRIEKFYHINIDDSREIFKLEFGNSLYENFRLQANLVVSFSEKSLKGYESDFKVIELFSEETKYFVKILYITRMDKYDGKCQKIANENGISPEFCLRRDC